MSLAKNSLRVSFKYFERLGALVALGGVGASFVSYFGVAFLDIFAAYSMTAGIVLFAVGVIGQKMAKKG